MGHIISFPPFTKPSSDDCHSSSRTNKCRLEEATEESHHIATFYNRWPSSPERSRNFTVRDFGGTYYQGSRLSIPKVNLPHGGILLLGPVVALSRDPVTIMKWQVTNRLRKTTVCKIEISGQASYGIPLFDSLLSRFPWSWIWPNKTEWDYRPTRHHAQTGLVLEHWQRLTRSGVLREPRTITANATLEAEIYSIQFLCPWHMLSFSKHADFKITVIWFDIWPILMCWVMHFELVLIRLMMQSSWWIY